MRTWKRRRRLVLALAVLGSIVGALTFGSGTAVAATAVCHARADGNGLACSGTVDGTGVGYIGLNYWNGSGANYYDGADGSSCGVTGYTGWSRCAPVDSSGAWEFNTATALPLYNVNAPYQLSTDAGAPSVDWSATWTVDTVEINPDGSQGAFAEYTLGPFAPPAGWAPPATACGYADNPPCHTVLEGDSLQALVDVRQGSFYVVGLLAALIFAAIFLRTFARNV
jgi:hypothetical protein